MSPVIHTLLRLALAVVGGVAGKVYGTKRVRPIFVDETNEILVVTVYVNYF
jgi:hypothetical protein